MTFSDKVANSKSIEHAALDTKSATGLYLYSIFYRIVLTTVQATQERIHE